MEEDKQTLNLLSAAGCVQALRRFPDNLTASKEGWKNPLLSYRDTRAVFTRSDRGISGKCRAGQENT
jgi:hypothetical protein